MQGDSIPSAFLSIRGFIIMWEYVRMCQPLLNCCLFVYFAEFIDVRHPHILNRALKDHNNNEEIVVQWITLLYAIKHLCVNISMLNTFLFCCIHFWYFFQNWRIEYNKHTHTHNIHTLLTTCYLLFSIFTKILVFNTSYCKTHIPRMHHCDNLFSVTSPRVLSASGFCAIASCVVLRR